MIRVFLEMGRVANTPHPAMRERRFSINLEIWKFGNVEMWKSEIVDYQISTFPNFPHSEGNLVRGPARLSRHDIPQTRTGGRGRRHPGASGRGRRRRRAGL